MERSNDHRPRFGDVPQPRRDAPTGGPSTGSDSSAGEQEASGYGGGQERRRSSSSRCHTSAPDVIARQLEDQLTDSLVGWSEFRSVRARALTRVHQRRGAMRDRSVELGLSTGIETGQTHSSRRRSRGERTGRAPRALPGLRACTRSRPYPDQASRDRVGQPVCMHRRSAAPRGQEHLEPKALAVVDEHAVGDDDVIAVHV